MTVLLQFLKMAAQLLNTNSLVIINSFLMSTVNRPQTLKTNSTIQPTLIIAAYKLIPFSMFEAAIIASFHDRFE